MMTKICDLAYEVDEDGSVNVEQDAGFGEVSRITLHPIHVRLLAEQVGLLAPSSNIEADRTIARLSRQMRILFDRIDQLDDWLNAAAQRGHEDLEAETVYSFATWELANEFVTDLPTTAASHAHGNTPESGGIPDGNPPKGGGLSGQRPPKSGAVSTARDTGGESSEPNRQLCLRSDDGRS